MKTKKKFFIEMFNSCSPGRVAIAVDRVNGPSITYYRPNYAASVNRMANIVRELVRNDKWRTRIWTTGLGWAAWPVEDPYATEEDTHGG